MNAWCLGWVVLALATVAAGSTGTPPKRKVPPSLGFTAQGYADFALVDDRSRATGFVDGQELWEIPGTGWTDHHGDEHDDSDTVSVAAEPDTVEPDSAGPPYRFLSYGTDAQPPLDWSVRIVSLERGDITLHATSHDPYCYAVWSTDTLQLGRVYVASFQWRVVGDRCSLRIGRPVLAD